MKNRLFGILMFALLLIGCGPAPTYVVQQQPVQQPGYDPNQFVYDPTPPVVVYFGGQRGYWGPNHIFFPMITLGGADGYYDSGHHFHTSVSNKTTIINNYNSEVKSHTVVTTGKPNYSQSGAKPNYGSGGSVGRGQVMNSPKPNYGSGSASVGRGSSPTFSSKPNYGNGGSVGRSSSPASSRPSYGSSSGSARRGK